MGAQTVSRYEIISKLGQGGMGEVFLARDTSLDRKVAIKFLPDEFASDPDRLSRFGREARLLASLAHPNVAAIHGLEQAGGRRFIVMELVEGETLAARIARAPLRIHEALDVCRQIAEGLEAAHDKGVIHRDLKPSNVIVSPEGKVKILDFGLAKSLEYSRGEAETTIMEDASREGIILGTVPYMSPEQARGRPLDPRTDVWSFGCVLYETLTGRPAFSGGNTTEVLARILEREPDWGALPALSPNAACLLRRCLEKDLHRRLRSIGDARLELEDTLAGRGPGQAAAAQATSRRSLVAVAAGGLLLGAAGAALWALLASPAAAPPHAVRFSVELPPEAPLKPAWNAQLALSPDGRTLAYSHGDGANQTTVVRDLAQLDARPLGTTGMSVPVFSRDGRYVLLMDPMQAALKKTPIGGGAPLLFAPYDMAFRGSWGEDDYYYWTTHYFGPVVRTPASGGRAEPVTALDVGKQERTHRHVQVLPGGQAIMFTVSTGGMSSFDEATIDLQTLGTKGRSTLIQGGFSARHSPSGHIVYARAGSLFAIPFDGRSVDPRAAPLKVVDGVFMSANSGSAHFDISPSGTLAYAVGRAEGGERTLVWVDRNGHPTPLPERDLPRASYLFPRISPEGTRIAFEVEGVNHDLYTYEPARGVTTKMTTDGVSHAPVWTPDGRRLAFRSWKAGTMTMWWMPADRSGPEERLTMVGARQSVVSFSPDGRYMAFNQMETYGMGTAAEMGMMGSDGMESGGTGVWILPMQGDRTPRRFATTSKFLQGSGRFSPDGRWVAYCSNHSGKNEVYVRPWPGPGAETKVSTDGGTDPVWSRDSGELFYRNGDKMMVVAVSTGPTFNASRPRMLWEGRYAHGMSSSCGPPGTTEGNYDVSPDGRRFLMVKDMDEGSQSTRIVVVLNFAEELKALSAQQKRE